MHVKLKIQKNNILQEAFLNLDIGTLEISDNWELSSMASEHGKYLNKLMWK